MPLKPEKDCVPGDIVNEYGDVKVINPGNKIGYIKRGRCTMTPDQARFAKSFGWVVTEVFPTGLMVVERQFERQG